MGQTQTTSSKAESYTWGVEIECFLPQSKVQELGISIGSYHQGHPLPAPFPQACPERSERGWTAERDGSLHITRRGYVAVEIVSPILQGRAGIEQVKQVAGTLKGIGAVVNLSCGFHCHTGLASVVGDQPADVADWVAKLLPSLGYYPNTNYIGGEIGFGPWRHFEQGPLESRGWWISSQHCPYLDGDGIFESAFSPSHWWNWRSGRYLSLGINRSRRDNQDSSGAYAYYAWNTRDTYREGSVSVDRGVRDGGTYTYYNLDQGVRPRDPLSLRLNAEYTHLSEPAADAGHDYQAVLTASYDITPEQCLAARGIWRDAGFSAYASYRRVVRRGMDAYVIIGDPDPNRTGFAERVAFKLI